MTALRDTLGALLIGAVLAIPFAVEIIKAVFYR